MFDFVDYQAAVARRKDMLEKARQRQRVQDLLDMGVRTVGIDAVTIERPFSVMADEYFATGNGSALWPAHLLGRKREYCHIERLASWEGEIKTRTQNQNENVRIGQ